MTDQPLLRPAALSLTILISFVGGCGGPKYPQTAKVTGHVTLDGNPLKTGQIRFYSNKGRLAYGNIIAGCYSLRTFHEGDGAVPGNHTVTITAVETVRKEPRNFKPPPNMTPEQIKDMREEETVVITKLLVPRRYSDRKKRLLTAEVKEGVNEFDFALQSNPK